MADGAEGGEVRSYALRADPLRPESPGRHPEGQLPLPDGAEGGGARSYALRTASLRPERPRRHSEDQMPLPDGHETVTRPQSQRPPHASLVQAMLRSKGKGKGHPGEEPC